MLCLLYQSKEKWQDRMRRLKYYAAALELIQKSKFEPKSKENPNKKDNPAHHSFVTAGSFHLGIQTHQHPITGIGA